MPRRASITEPYALERVKSPIVAHPSGQEGASPIGDFIQLKIGAQMHSPPPHLQPYPFGSLIADRRDEADKALLVAANRRSRPKRIAEKVE